VDETDALFTVRVDLPIETSELQVQPEEMSAKVHT
jgi:hypothetical protein